MEIIKGNRYVYLDDSNEYFTKGNVYSSETTNDFITSNNGVGLGGECIERRFKPYSELDKVYTKATPLLNDIFESYDGKKYKTIGQEVKFFDNVMRDSTGWFVSTSGLDDDFYLSDNYTYLSEKAFIEFMDLGKYIGCLNTEPNLLTTQQTTKTEVFNPQKHYDNSKGSLYKVATERGWGAYLFDVVKRLERGGKKDPLRQEIEKSIDVLKIWLNEIE